MPEPPKQADSGQILRLPQAKMTTYIAAEKNEMRTRQLVRETQHNFLEIGKLLKENMEKVYWSEKGHGSFADYIESLGISKSAGYSMINAYEFLSLGKLTEAEMLEIGIAKTQLLLVLARRGELTPEIIEVAKTASVKGLKEKLEPGPISALEDKPGQEPETVLASNHSELINIGKQIGQTLGKVVETESGPVYKHDVSWKDNKYKLPSLVIEVCDKGNLDKDIQSLNWAVENWGAKAILVIVDEKDYSHVHNKLPSGRSVFAIKAADFANLHSVLGSAGKEVLKLMFGV